MSLFASKCINENYSHQPQAIEATSWVLVSCGLFLLVLLC